MEPRTNLPPSTDHIREHEIAQSRVKAHEQQMKREDEARRAKQLADQTAAEDGSSPTVLGRVFSRQAAGVVELVLVDHLPANTPLRLLVARGRVTDGASMVGSLRALGHTLLEAGGFSEPSCRFWSAGVIDPFGGGGGFVPDARLPAIGEPLYSTPSVKMPEPSDGERASAIDAAHIVGEHLSLTKARSAALASALRAALVAGEHAVLALVDVLEQRAGIAPTDTDSPPRAA